MTEQHTEFENLDEETGAHEAPEVSQERDFESEARQMGWKPKEEWDGDPDQWRDAEAFVKRGEEIHSYIKRDRDRERERREKAEKDFQDRLKRLDDSNRKALEILKKQYETRLAELDARQDKAVEEGDLETYKALKKQREELGPAPEVPEESGQEASVDPTVQEWASKPENDWFHTDDVMRAVAIQVAGRVAQNGGDVPAQLRAAESEVRRRFPEHFGDTKPRPVVETGGQPPKTTKKEKGVTQLPREAREAGEKFVREGIYKDLSEYAKDYWEQA